MTRRRPGGNSSTKMTDLMLVKIHYRSGTTVLGFMSPSLGQQFAEQHSRQEYAKGGDFWVEQVDHRVVQAAEKIADSIREEWKAGIRSVPARYAV